MGAARQGFNLFNRYGREASWKWIKRYKSIPTYMLVDTFGPIKCWLMMGHKAYDTNARGWPPEPACKRCHRFLPKKWNDVVRPGWEKQSVPQPDYGTVPLAMMRKPK